MTEMGLYETYTTDYLGGFQHYLRKTGSHMKDSNQPRAVAQSVARYLYYANDPVAKKPSDVAYKDVFDVKKIMATHRKILSGFKRTV